MIRYCAIALLCLCAACTSSQTASPTPSASVTMSHPSIGTIIYSDTIYVAGSADGLASRFQVRATTGDDQVIAEGIIQPQDGTWSSQLPHHYEGDPTEITISAFAPDSGEEYDITSAVLSPVENRPEGTYGLILQPTEGDTAGGEQVPLFGIISGVEADELTITLMMSSGDTSTQTVPIDYPNRMDEIPWQADLMTSEQTGPATISLSYTDSDGTINLLDEVNIVLTAIAG